MEAKSVQKYIRMSPRKLRLVADMVRKMTPQEAVDVLPHVSKRAALPMLKVVKTAIANAKVKNMNISDLTFKEIQINVGPTLKRGRAVSRGRWHKVLKRMSHIRVILEDKQKEKPVKVKSEKKKVKKAKPKGVKK